MPGRIRSRQQYAMPMTLVREMGYRYLWVDSLCIVQDDGDAKHEAIHNMDLIYSRAYATLVDLVGKDANSGISGIRPHSRQPQMMHVTSTDGDVCIHTPPPLLFCIELSPWNTRAWTFQEKILSRRCLYFTSQYVYFQCGELVTAETDPGLQDSKEFDKHEEFNLVRTLRRDGTSELGTGLSKNELHAYFLMVEAYTKRSLSFPADILNAFTGSLGVLEQCSGEKFLYGLPTSALDLALLWVEVEPPDLRTIPPQDFQRMGPLPQWSWAAWVGSVRYTIDHTRRRDESSYATPEVDLFVTFHHGTLSAHPVRRRASGVLDLDNERSGRVTVHGVCGPDLGQHVLQFWAWTASADRFRIDTRSKFEVSDPSLKGAGSKQKIMRMQNWQGTHCGLLYAAEQVLERKLRYLNPDSLELVLISRYGNADKRRRGPDGLEAHIPYFDEKAYPYRGEGSGLVNFIMIQWDHEVAERIGVGQMQVKAWEEALPVKKHISPGLPV